MNLNYPSLLLAILILSILSVFSHDVSASNLEVPSINSPCELISIDEIKTVCELEEGVEIEKADKDYTYPTCTFKWEDGQVSRTMTVGGNEMSIDMPSEVMVVMVSDASDEMYQQSISVYKDGLDVEVGEKAIWGTDMSQLSFLSNGHLFHVNVKVSNDAERNKQKAIELAELLIGKL